MNTAQNLNDDRKVDDSDMALRLPTWVIERFNEEDRLALVEHGMEDTTVYSKKAEKFPLTARLKFFYIDSEDDLETI